MTPSQGFQRDERHCASCCNALPPAMSDVRSRHPEADERECLLRVASRRVPADLMLKAYGWDVKEKGY